MVSGNGQQRQGVKASLEEARKEHERSVAANEELLVLNHNIRQHELYIAIAKRRRRLAALSYMLGPVLLLAIYVIFWLPWFQASTIVAICVPCIPLAIGFCIAAVRLSRDPGGPLAPYENGAQRRQSESQLELALAKVRDTRKLKVAHGTFDTKTRRLIYKEEAYADIDKLRIDSKRYRNVNNFFQGTLIIGSLGATGSSAIAAELGSFRWATFGISLAVGISSGFMGYYKYKERSFYLQQTADAIEHEWEAFEVGVGRYKRAKDEEQALADFVEEVHRLKSEQRKRQQNLEQPPEMRSANEA